MAPNPLAQLNGWREKIAKNRRAGGRNPARRPGIAGSPALANGSIALFLSPGPAAGPGARKPLPLPSVRTAAMAG